MIQYSLRNLIYYRKKYAIVVLLIIVMSTILFLVLSLYFGLQKVSLENCRDWGDLYFYFNPKNVDQSQNYTPGLENFDYQQASKKLYTDLVRYIEKEIKPDSLIKQPRLFATIYTSNFTYENDVVDYDTADSIKKINLIEGKKPEYGEIAIDQKFNKKVSVGDSVTFAYENKGVYDTISLTISGFFLQNGSNSAMYLNAQHIKEIMGDTVPGLFILFYNPKESSKPLITQTIYQKHIDDIRMIIATSFNKSDITIDNIPGFGWYSAYRAFQQLEGVRSLLFLIGILCVMALCIIAVTSIVNVLYITVLDRIKIIGTFFSFGMKRIKGVFIIAGEVAVLSFIAATVGIFLGFFIGNILSNVKITTASNTVSTFISKYNTIYVIFSLKTILITYCCAILFSIVTSFYTLRKLLKGRIVKLIHYVG